MVWTTEERSVLDQAFQALTTYNYGSGRAVLLPIDKAVAACGANLAACAELERRLSAALKQPISQVAQEYLCRQLSVIGTAASVSVLAEFLTDWALSHLARFALERISCSEAVQALRESLPKLKGLDKVGVICSLGLRRDPGSIPALKAATGDSDPQVGSAAVAALGEIGTSEALQALQSLRSKLSPALRPVLLDACLVGAERLLAADKKSEAAALYQMLAGSEQPRHVRLAANRGLLRAARGK
jgi:HEAT repeat protein